MTVRLPEGTLTSLGLEGIRTAFFAQYEAIYGYAHRHLGLEVMTLRLTASGGTPELRLAGVDEDATSVERARKGSRPIYVGVWGRYAEVAVYDRYALRGGAELVGPCIIEEPDSTAVIGPEVTVRVDTYLNLVATFDQR